MNRFATALALTSALLVDSTWAETSLLLERKISLGEVRGRIDHLEVDLKRNRLFVAELENDTVAVIDLNANQVMHVISELRKPQGLGYHPSTDALYVANGRWHGGSFSRRRLSTDRTDPIGGWCR
jgi:YVTN family beta-propeller protein